MQEQEMTELCIFGKHDLKCKSTEVSKMLLNQFFEKIVVKNGCLKTSVELNTFRPLCCLNLLPSSV